MTIAPTARKAGPLLGNGSTTSFSFGFKVFATGDVKVAIADSAGVETVLEEGTHYTVSLNANQETSPGGSVTYPVSGSPLPTGSVLSVIGDLDYDQSLDLPSGGNFSPLALENQLDRATMQIQQLKEQVDRSAKLPQTSQSDADALSADLVRLADSADNIDSVAGSIANVNVVAGIAANVAVVAGNTANINAVAGNAANITAVSANKTNIDAVAANIADIDAVVANLADIQSAPENAARVNDTVTQAVDGEKQLFLAGTDYTKDVTTQLTLTYTPAKSGTVSVILDGIEQHLTEWSLAGRVITFTAAIPANKVEVHYHVPSRFVGLSGADLTVLGSAQASAQAGADSAWRAASTATSAKTAAEAAHDATVAGAAPTVYANTADGLAATTTGKYFSVPSAEAAEYLILYKNSGGAAVEVKRYPSAGTVNGNNGSKTLAVLTDTNDQVVMSLTADGKLYVAGNSGPLTDAPQIQETSGASLFAVSDSNGRSLLSLTEAGALEVYGRGNLLDRVASVDFITGQEYASFGDTSRANYFYDKSKSSLATRVGIHKYLVGPTDDANTSFCRFPFALPLTDSTGLLFFSQRHSSANNGEEKQRTVVRDYTIDYASKTVTTSATRVIDQPTTWAGGTGGYASGPSAVRLPSGRILVAYNRLVGDGLLSDASYERAQYLSYSDDSGQTWSAPTKIMGSAQIYDELTGGTGGVPGSVPSRNGCVTGTENCFIRIPSGAHKGRLVHSLYTFGNYIGAMYSDDNGATWVRGTLAPPITGKTYTESAIAYCSDGSIVMLTRCDNNADKVLTSPGVGRFVSTDGGSTWTYTGHVSSAGFGNSSIALVNTSLAPATGFEKFISACSVSTVHYRRDDYRLRLSYDKGNTFIADVKLFPPKQGVGYSNLVRLANGHYVLAYETFNGEGAINTMDGIGMYVFNEAEIFANATSI